jgi:hypothetical protein
LNLKSEEKLVSQAFALKSNLYRYTEGDGPPGPWSDQGQAREVRQGAHGGDFTEEIIPCSGLGPGRVIGKRGATVMRLQVGVAQSRSGGRGRSRVRIPEQTKPNPHVTLPPRVAQSRVAQSRSKQNTKRAWNEEDCIKSREAAAALVGAHGEAPGAFGPLAVRQSMRSLFFLKLL